MRRVRNKHDLPKGLWKKSEFKYDGCDGKRAQYEAKRRAEARAKAKSKAT